MDEWRFRSRRLTFVLILASFLLIGPGLAGLGSSVPLALGLAVGAAGCWSAREQLRTLPTVIGYDIGWYARDSYLAAGLAAVVVLLGLGGPAVELQALGGVIGLVGMLNYFLRPLYLFVAGVFWRVVGN